MPLRDLAAFDCLNLPEGMLTRLNGRGVGASHCSRFKLAWSCASLITAGTFSSLDHRLAVDHAVGGNMAGLEFPSRPPPRRLVLALHAVADEIAGISRTALQGLDFLPALAGLHRRGRHRRPAALPHDRLVTLDRGLGGRDVPPEAVGMPSAILVIERFVACRPIALVRLLMVARRRPETPGCPCRRREREQSRTTARLLLLLRLLLLFFLAGQPRNGPAPEGCTLARRSVTVKPVRRCMLLPLSQFRHEAYAAPVRCGFCPA